MGWLLLLIIFFPLWVVIVMVIVNHFSDDKRRLGFPLANEDKLTKEDKEVQDKIKKAFKKGLKS